LLKNGDNRTWKKIKLGKTNVTGECTSMGMWGGQKKGDDKKKENVNHERRSGGEP